MTLPLFLFRMGKIDHFSNDLLLKLYVWLEVFKAAAKIHDFSGSSDGFPEGLIFKMQLYTEHRALGSISLRSQ